jgi:hypothetical protein
MIMMMITAAALTDTAAVTAAACAAQAEPMGLVVPVSAASNLSTLAVHGSATAGSPQAMAAR